LGQYGVHGALWLGERGGGEGERGPGGALVGQEQRGEACNIFFWVIDKVLAWILFSLLPTTKDKKWRGCCR
jgi:hypothetical protein